MELEGRGRDDDEEGKLDEEDKKGG